MYRLIIAFIPFVFSLPAQADLKRHIESNLIAALYHEMAHALIDQLNLPIYGMEEDAADVFSTYLLDELHNKEEALIIAKDVAFGYRVDALRAKNEGDGPRDWGLHGLDGQRRWSHICLFVGADFDTREEFARGLELPDERLKHCPIEHAIAEHSWGQVVGKMRGISMQGEMRLEGFSTHKNTADGRVLQKAIDLVNTHFFFPQDLPVRIEPCDDANAYYHGDRQIIQICTEYSGLIAENYRRAIRRISPPE